MADEFMRNSFVTDELRSELAQDWDAGIQIRNNSHHGGKEGEKMGIGLMVWHACAKKINPQMFGGGEPAPEYKEINYSGKKVKVDYPSDGSANPIAGFIYVDIGGLRGAERAIKIMRSGTWILTEASRPGLFDRELASGKISSKGILEGLPETAFQRAVQIWKGGNINAYFGDEMLDTLKK